MDATDRDLMIRTVIGEAGNQGPAGMAAVAHVINNRATAGKYGGSTPSEVVLAPNQFEPWSTRSHELFSIDTNSPQYKKAAAIVDGVTNGTIPDVTNGATHFMNTDTVRDRNGGTLGNAAAWAKNQTAQIGAHTFYAPDAPNIGGTGTGQVGKFGLSGVTGSTASPTGPLLPGILSKPGPSTGGGGSMNAFSPNSPSVPIPQTGLEALIRTAAGQGTYTPPVVAKLQGLAGALSQLFGGGQAASAGSSQRAGPALPALGNSEPAPAPAQPAETPANPGEKPGIQEPPAPAPLTDVNSQAPARNPGGKINTPQPSDASLGQSDLSSSLASLFGGSNQAAA